jgi:calcineurin-like phosphoesterase family protein
MGYNRTFCVADTHFNHARIIEFGRPFKDMEEHNETIIRNWNSVVLPDDKVLMLGDCVFGGGEGFKIFGRLNGRKSLVLGNHDQKKRPYYENYFEKVEAYLEQRMSDGTFLFSHMPVHPSQMEKRYAVNVHGHVHANTLMIENSDALGTMFPDDRYYNVSLENINYTPILLDKIRDSRKHRFTRVDFKNVDPS